MTLAQWIFHYVEISINKGKEVEMKKTLLDVITSEIEFVGIMANPDIGMKLLEDRRNKKVAGDIESGEDDLLKFMNEIAEKLPEVVEVDMTNENKNKFFLPKVDLKRKNRGIEIIDDGAGAKNG